jgi:hypothetical protein
MIRTVVFFTFLLLASVSFGGGISKGFEALQQFNYFEAKKIFTKYLKKEPCAANYGLATIYFRNDNPFHSLDSALVRIQIAEGTYNKTSAKTKEKLLKYGFDYLHIADLRAQISHELFIIELKAPNEQSLDKYQAKHLWASERFRAIEMRDSLGYLQAEKLGTSVGFQQFIDKYPESKLRTRAQQEFYRLQYSEKTNSGMLSAYMNFETSFPNNPYVVDAQDQIYNLSTKNNTPMDYDVFIKKFPKNRNVEDAWRKLYQLYMVDFSKERIASFKEKYPNYPWMDDLETEQALSETIFLPYKTGGLFGWMDQNGNVLVKAQYNNAGFFKDGLAWAEKSGKYGFVNKANKVIVPFQFESVTDFEKGRSIVELNGLYGCIDRTGAYTVPPQFKDLGIFIEGLMYAQKDSLYGYYDGFGNVRIQSQFDEAFSFEKGKAKVIFQGATGIIDQYGSYVVKPLYEELIPFTDSIMIIESGDFYEFLKLKGEQKLNLKVDEVGALQNDRALVEFDGKIGYINSKAELVIPFKYETFTNVRQDGAFDGNYAKIALKGKYGVIDKTGKVIIPAAYPKMGAVGTLIAIEKAGKWGFIDLNNQWKIQPIYEFAESFSDGLGIVQNLTLYGAVNSAGKVVIPIEFTTINKIDKTHYNVTKGAKNGIYSNTGQQLVPAEYNRIQRVNEDWYALFKGTELHYFQLSTNTLVIPKI